MARAPVFLDCSHLPMEKCLITPLTRDPPADTASRDFSFLIPPRFLTDTTQLQTYRLGMSPHKTKETAVLFDFSVTWTDTVEHEPFTQRFREPTMVFCEGPCDRQRPADRMYQFGRDCDHIVCGDCVKYSAALRNSDGSPGCPNPVCNRVRQMCYVGNVGSESRRTLVRDLTAAAAEEEVNVPKERFLTVNASVKTFDKQGHRVTKKMSMLAERNVFLNDIINSQIRGLKSTGRMRISVMDGTGERILGQNDVILKELRQFQTGDKIDLLVDLTV